MEQALNQFMKNRMAVGGLLVIILLFAVAFSTIVIDFVTRDAIYNNYVINQNLAQRLAAPSASHIFGCDEFGRDLFLRILWGTKYSLFIGIGAILLAMCIGMPIGMIAGYYGGRIDNVVMRLMDVILAVPSMLLAMAIVAALGTSTVNLLVAMSVANIARFSRIARASVMTIKDNEYIEAARAIGANDREILVKYIFPNAFSPNLVQLTLGIGNSILLVAGLSYLGLGVQPPSPEWGAILTTAKTYMRDAWHISVFPGMFLVVSVIAFNLLGDGLRDAMDPKLKK
ncbi:ABC transporter permease [Cloacibacillus evryensis]|uniref:ABC transporter permease n=3 Tax=Cloacibacillus evryensis TaxID=508460 RepID=A0AAW5K9R7_9BACT|nr:ABC transporter permease [Cloacibacillus evryensis]MCQ4815268.1 ABC transporter permease [Cloacibacillus evryensis]